MLIILRAVKCKSGMIIENNNGDYRIQIRFTAVFNEIWNHIVSHRVGVINDSKRLYYCTEKYYIFISPIKLTWR
jgi:hypothetical protein